MRVAHFTDTYLPRRDGVVTSVQTLDRQLRDAGHDSLLVVPGVAQLRLTSRPRQRHVERVAAWRPDIVHVHTPGPVGLLGVLTARRLGLPLVHTYHTDLDAYVDAYRIPTRVLRVAVAVPTPAVLDRTRLPIQNGRVRVIPTGVGSANVPTGAVEDFRRRYRIPPGDRVVLAVGRVNEEKGVDLLLAAFLRVVAAHPRARLVLVGQVYDQGLVAAAGPRVVFTGRLPPETVAAAYALTQRTGGVLAFPSRTDTQGLVLQEAAHAGVPAVMTDAELRSRGALAGAALLAPPTVPEFAAAVITLLANPVLARSLADRARRAALAHTPAAYGDAMLGVYLEVSRRVERTAA
jgi:1,2-diacylglycerol 3-alpha-glucosyltransferase